MYIPVITGKLLSTPRETGRFVAEQGTGQRGLPVYTAPTENAECAVSQPTLEIAVSNRRG